MMDDLISRQAAIECLNGEMKLSSFENAQIVQDYLVRVVEKLYDLPSAQPEIIRCQDCKHWDTAWTPDWSHDHHYCPMIDGVCKGDFYCADAERKENR